MEPPAPANTMPVTVLPPVAALLLPAVVVAPLPLPLPDPCVCGGSSTNWDALPVPHAPSASMSTPATTAERSKPRFARRAVRSSGSPWSFN